MIEGVKITRQDETTVPRQISISYYEMENSDQLGTQLAGPLEAKSKEDATVQIPIKFSATSAKRLAEVLLAAALAERTQVQLSLPLSFARIEPADVVWLQGNDGTTFKLRVVKASLNGMKVECEMVFEPDSYVSSATGSATTEKPPMLVIPTPTYPLALDLPALEPIANGVPQVYVATVSEATSAFSAVIFITDAGIRIEVETTTKKSTTGKVVSNALRSWDNCGSFDFCSSIDVTLNHGELYSSTVEELLANRYLNLAAIGTNNSGSGSTPISCLELVQFVSAILIGPKTYRLTGFLRGRFGTDHYAKPLVVSGNTQYNPHSSGGDYFILIEDSLKRIPVSTSTRMTPLVGKDFTYSIDKWVGAPVDISLITVGTSLEEYNSCYTVEATTRPRALTSVAGVKTTEGTVFKWDYRTVTATGFFNMLEYGTSVVIEIAKTPAGAAVRTLSTAETTTTYTSAQKTTDNVSGTLYARLYCVRYGLYSPCSIISFEA